MCVILLECRVLVDVGIHGDGRYYLSLTWLYDEGIEEVKEHRLALETVMRCCNNRCMKL